MNTSATGLVLNGSQRESAVGVLDTPWGYVIRKNEASRNRARWGEVIATVLCVIFGFGAYAQWLLPGTINSAAILPLKIAVTIMLFVFAALMYLIARRGLLFETQIDTEQQKVRLTRRNREGNTTHMARFAFSQIERVYIKRSQSRQVADRLFIQAEGYSSPVLLASGSGISMEALQARVRTDFRARPGVAKIHERSKERPRMAPQVRSAFSAA